MAKLILINAETYRPGANEIGQVVDVKPDDYKPGPAEAFGFEIVTVPGTVEDYYKERSKKLTAVKPADMTEREAVEWTATKKYSVSVSNKTALSLADAISATLPAVKPIIAVER